MPNNQLQKVRNFSIIAHIDHGKTTLTDAFLQTTGTVSKLNFHTRMMDSNPIEQEKGGYYQIGASAHGISGIYSQFN